MKPRQAPEAQFDYAVIPEWPVLAWVATCGHDRVDLDARWKVYCGSGVERHAMWFGECVWAGDFLLGDFDQVEAVFGSGGRANGETVTFVSSASTVDRLHLFERNSLKVVSNSLAAICGMFDLTVDAKDAGHYGKFGTVMLGLEHFKKCIDTSGGAVTLVYHKNLVWSDGALGVVDKPGPQKFERFEDYRDFLCGAVRQMTLNATDRARSVPFPPLVTLSNGYDSTAVAAVGSAGGVRGAIGFIEGHSESENDLQTVAKVLRLDLLLKRSRGKAEKDDDAIAAMLSSGGEGYEAHFFQLEPHLKSRLLMTGFMGDKLWGFSLKDGGDLARGSASGLSLSEWRLSVPFIHAPVPYLGARQLRQLNAIARDEKMSAWSVGGAYDRPLARRLAEERGVPRDSFGRRKSGASLSVRSPATVAPNVRRAMADWLKTAWLSGQPWQYRALVATIWLRTMAASTLGFVRKRTKLPKALRLVTGLQHRLMEYPEFRYSFAWALARRSDHYRTGLQRQKSLDRTGLGD